jgi:signal transduction histidine kinase
MSAIQGFSWLIQKRCETMTPEQGRHWANEIIRATEQLKDMMDAITESWRTSSIQPPPSLPVRVIDSIHPALEILASQFAAEHHETQNDVAESLWVMAEPDRLRHVFSNLLGNAAKYSPANSRLWITASIRSGADLVALSRERGARDEDEEAVVNVTANSGPWGVISVHDEGQGISLADQRRIFAKFVRLKLTTNVRGTGLGLYICRRYIEAMGGEIWVESAPGQGSTFSFCLPLAQDAGKE